MALVKLLLPRTLVGFNEATDTVFFLAGPIKGAGDWQNEAIDILQKYADTLDGRDNVYVVCPSMYQPNHKSYSLRVMGIIEENYTEKQRKITYSRTDWERYHLEIASRLGCIIFWLGKEDEKNPRKREDGPYARDTYGELGEWRARMYMSGNIIILRLTWYLVPTRTSTDWNKLIEILNEWSGKVFKLVLL